VTETTAVTLCIINYNGAEHLKSALSAVRAQAWKFADVLLVDNASEDDSLDVAKSLYPSIRIVRLPRNAGPAGARNAGFEAADNDLIIFQDNDIQLEPDTAARLVRRLQGSPGALLVAPRVVYADDPGTVQFDSADCHFLGLMATRNADRALGDLDQEPAETTSLVTACFLVDRSLWRGGAPFDESLEFNLEDHDFGVRACLAGHTLCIEPKARVRHGSGTPGLSYRPGRTPEARRMFYLTLNRWIVIRKCYSLKTFVLLSPALTIFELMQLAWLASQGHLCVWVKACKSYVERRTTLREARTLAQRTRRLRDIEILRDARLPLARHARDSFAGRYLVPVADVFFRGYWRLIRNWI
jgi:GT2 family glycosyltransferase